MPQCCLTCILQVHGNQCPQQLHPSPKLEISQISCRSSLRPFLPTMKRNRASVPVHPMNEIFPGPGLVPESLALVQMGQIVQKAQMKKRILLPQLKRYPNAREAPQVQHLQECRKSSCQSHVHLQNAENLHAQRHRLDDQHPRPHPEGSNPGL